MAAPLWNHVYKPVNPANGFVVTPGLLNTLFLVGLYGHWSKLVATLTVSRVGVTIYLMIVG